MNAGRSVAGSDSAAAMLRALARFLHGREFPGLGLASMRALRPLAPLVNALPDDARRQIYIWSGCSEAIPPRKLRDVRAEAMSEWVVRHYPRRRYPLVFAGSSNGALVHLCKRLRLGAAYERFLDGALEEGGTLVVVECRRGWPTTSLGLRHVFQHGALGGAKADEYMHGGERVEDFLRRHGSARRRWQPPEPDGERPEAEWGFAPELGDDLERLAVARGWRIRRLVFEEPEDLSPVVADLYRRWYERREIESRRLLVGSFILLEPWWTLRTASVPYWTKFSVEPDAEALERYLSEHEPLPEVAAMLFSHGVDSIGLAGVDRWRGAVDRLLGVDEDAFPRDFAVFLRYEAALRALEERAPLPEEPLRLEELDALLAERDYSVRLD